MRNILAERFLDGSMRMTLAALQKPPACLLLGARDAAQTTSHTTANSNRVHSGRISPYVSHLPRSGQK